MCVLINYHLKVFNLKPAIYVVSNLLAGMFVYNDVT